MKKTLFVAATVGLLSACSATEQQSERGDIQSATVAQALGTGGQGNAASGPMADRCGSIAGLQPGAAWAMRGGCPTHAAIAPVHGATQANVSVRVDLLGTAEAAPAVGVDGAAYVGTNIGWLTAVNPQNGQPLWDVFVRGAIRSSPAIGHDGTIYVGADTSGLHAIDPAAHLEKWSFDSTRTISASPAVGPDGTIYVGDQNGDFLAVNPNGTQKWKYATGGAIESSAALGTDGTIYFGSDDNNVYALTPQGTLKWKRPVANDVRSSPAVGGGAVYVGSDANKLHALDAATGAILWERAVTFAGAQSSPAIGTNGNVFVGAANSKVLAFSPAGTPLWTYTTGGAVNSSPVIDVDGRLYVGADDRKLHAIDSATGLPIFTYTAGGAVQSPTLDTDGRVLFGARDSSFYSVGVGSRADRYDLNASATPTDGPQIDETTGETVNVSAIVGEDGEPIRFISKELALGAADSTKLNAFLSRYGGTLVDTVDFGAEAGDDLHFEYEIRLDPSRAPDPATIPANLARIDPQFAQDPESFQLSDPTGLATLSIWADARANGYDVDLNSVGDLDSIATGSTAESVNGPGFADWTTLIGVWSPNTFDWVHLAGNTIQTIDVTGAWQLLQRAGKLNRTVRAAVADSGFVRPSDIPNNDFPAATLLSVTPGPFVDPFISIPKDPLTLDQRLDRYHGLHCALTGYGEVDNGRGAAGPGGPVVSRLYMANQGAKITRRKFVRNMRELMRENVDVVSVSNHWIMRTRFMGPMVRRVIERAGRHELLVVASAGNDNTNIDKKRGFLSIDSHWYMPCEANGVFCVGGLAHNTLDRQEGEGGSNWGPDDVDIWAPYLTAVGQVPSGGGDTEIFSGTSAATPFVAGIAALVKAADPSLKDEEIRSIMHATSKPSQNPEVKNGIVQALAAVSRALGPVFKITEPGNNQTFSFNVAPHAKVFWSDGREGGQAPTVDWLVNGMRVAGGLETFIPNALLNPGANTIEARGTFIGGRVLTDAVTVTRALPSSLHILLPVPGQAIHADDPTVRLLSEPQGPIEWLEDGAGPFVRSGDVTLLLPIATPGVHVLDARLTNGSATIQDETNVFVLPVGFPKTTITITQPNFTSSSPGPFTFNSASTDFLPGAPQSPTSGDIVWVVSDATTGAVQARRIGPSGSVTLNQTGRFVFTVFVSKMVDLTGDGVPDASATVASDARTLTLTPILQ